MYFSSGATVYEKRFSRLLQYAYRVFWHLLDFLLEWCLKAASDALKVLWNVLSSCTQRKSYFMRINIGSKSVLEAKHILSGFRLWFNYASFAWKSFCKHSKRLHLLSDYVIFLSCGVISIVIYFNNSTATHIKLNKSVYLVGIIIIFFLQSLKSFNSYFKCLLFYCDSFSLRVI